MDLVATVQRPLPPFQVFQARQGFIIGPGQSQRSPYGCIGVVAEGIFLVGLGYIGVPAGKDALFRKSAARGTNLFAINQGDLLVSEGFCQFFQPVGVNRVDMRAGKHQNISAGSGNPAVKRAAKGEFLRRNAHHPRSASTRHGNRLVG